MTQGDTPRFGFDSRPPPPTTRRSGHRLIADDIDVVADTVDQQAADLRNPPMTTTELLDGLAAAGLVRTVDALRTREP